MSNHTERGPKITYSWLRSRPISTPEVKHVYQHPSIDSLRWNFLTFREDDIVIATSGKTGTTWTQGIVANLIFLGRDLPGSPLEMSPWLEMRMVPLEHVLTQLEQQTHRRFIKTHLPLDGLRFDQRVKYLSLIAAMATLALNDDFHD